MKNFIIATFTMAMISGTCYSFDELNSHERFETGEPPPIINYDPEFRPPMPMPQPEQVKPEDDEEHVHFPEAEQY